MEASQMTLLFDNEPEPPPVVAAPKKKQQIRERNHKTLVSQMQRRAQLVYVTLSDAYKDKAVAALAQRRFAKAVTKEDETELAISNWQCWIEILQQMARLQAGKPLAEDTVSVECEREAYQATWSYPQYVSPNAKGANL